MHAVVEQHKEYRALLKERARIEDAKAKWSLRVQRERAAHEERVRTYNEEVERALLMGEDADRIKAPGEWQPPAGSAHTFMNKLIEIEGATRQWAARRQSELSRRVAEREAELLAGVAPIVRQLEAVAAELEELRSAESFLRAAAGLAPPPGQPVTARSLLDRGPRAGTLVTRPAGEPDPFDRMCLDGVDIE